MSDADRSEVEILRKRNYSMREIARTLKRHVSGIWYELRKSRKTRAYDAAYAKYLSYVRMRRQRRIGRKIALDPSLKTFVELHLLDDQSPDAIAGRLRRIEKVVSYVSPAAIKRYIKSVYGRRIESHRAKIFKRKHWRRRVKTTLDGKRPISKRPKRINERKGLGHMEGDFIVSGRSGKGLGLVLIDRNLRKVLLERILPVSVRNVERALLRMKKRFPEIATITGNVHTHMAVFSRMEKCQSIWQKQLKKSGCGGCSP